MVLPSSEHRDLNKDHTSLSVLNETMWLGVSIITSLGWRFFSLREGNGKGNFSNRLIRIIEIYSLSESRVKLFLLCKFIFLFQNFFCFLFI